MTTIKDLEDLAPQIHRQRLIIEGYPSFEIMENHVKAYLAELSDVCGMIRLGDPVTRWSPEFGWAGWIHWETSGAHFYAWNQPVLFFSADIYTCKAFPSAAAVRFTKDFFNATRIVFKDL